jgi:hypothetical protein
MLASPVEGAEAVEGEATEAALSNYAAELEEAAFADAEASVQLPDMIRARLLKVEQVGGCKGGEWKVCKRAIKGGE